jgi:hypothetical protein
MSWFGGSRKQRKSRKSRKSRKQRKSRRVRRDGPMPMPSSMFR